MKKKFRRPSFKSLRIIAQKLNPHPPTLPTPTAQRPEPEGGDGGRLRSDGVTWIFGCSHPKQKLVYAVSRPSPLPSRPG